MIKPTVSIVTLQFNGNETYKELYEISLKSVDEMVTLSIQNKENMQAMKLKLLEYLAIIDFKQAEQHRPRKSLVDTNDVEG